MSLHLAERPKADATAHVAIICPFKYAPVEQVPACSDTCLTMCEAGFASTAGTWRSDAGWHGCRTDPEIYRGSKSCADEGGRGAGNGASRSILERLLMRKLRAYFTFKLHLTFKSPQHSGPGRGSGAARHHEPPDWAVESVGMTPKFLAFFPSCCRFQAPQKQ